MAAETNFGVLFHNSPTINPETGRTIKIDGPTYRKLVTKYGAPPSATSIVQLTDVAGSTTTFESSVASLSTNVSSITQVTNPNLRPPHSRSNFLTVDRRIIVGAIPQDPSTLVAYGVTVILNLSGKEYSVDEKIIYLSYPIGSGKAPSIKMANEILARLLDFNSQNHIIYIHCVGGHGRAGTIAALLVGRLYQWDAIDAIQYVEKMRETREDTSRNFIPTPEMPAQVNLVVKLLGNHLGRPIPDRSDKSWMKVRKQNR